MSCRGLIIAISQHMMSIHVRLWGTLRFDDRVLERKIIQFFIFI